MTYQGDYIDAHIYGTANNHKIKVSTTDDATFLSCKLTVDFNGEEWIHTFEAPFFQNTAELYFENYIHSIITQKFKLDELTVDDYKFYSFDLAVVKMELKEMDANVILSELELNFSMVLGNFAALKESFLTDGVKRLLPVAQANFLTDNGVLSFSFLATTYPSKLIVNDVSKTLPTADTTTKKLHTLTIPVKKIISAASELKLTLNFASNGSFELGSFSVLNEGVDHNLIAYQNEFGTLSVIELTGELQTDEEYKESIFRHSNAKKVTLTPTKIEIKKMYMLNTGHMRDVSKYRMLQSVLKSFNRFISDDGLQRIILSSAQRIKPFKSDYYLNNETLKFKLSENDDIYYRAF